MEGEIWEEIKEREKKGPATQLHCLRRTKKKSKKYIETEKGKTPKAKGKWNKLSQEKLARASQTKARYS